MSFTNITPKRVRNAYVWSSGMAIDADGARNAYRPDNQGLDDNRDAMGAGGKFVGIVTINGVPITLPDGSYISTTALQDKTKQVIDPARYVDASAVPYLAICPEFIAMGVKLGDLAVVVRGDKLVALICADICPHNHWGECSMAAGPGVGLSGSPRNGGCDDGCTFIVFPGTANNPPWPRSVVEFQQAATDLFDAWGGMAAIKALQEVT